MQFLEIEMKLRHVTNYHNKYVQTTSVFGIILKDEDLSPREKAKKITDLILTGIK